MWGIRTALLTVVLTADKVNGTKWGRPPKRESNNGVQELRTISDEYING